MVKVIKKGSEDPAPEVVKEIVCGNCASTLEYVPKDVKNYSGTDYGGGPDGREWIDCPECNAQVTIRSW